MSRTIILRRPSQHEGQSAVDVVAVTFQGFAYKEEVELRFVEIDRDQGREQIIGSLRGTIEPTFQNRRIWRKGMPREQTFVPFPPIVSHAKTEARLAFSFRLATNVGDSSSVASEPIEIEFDVPSDRHDRYEGDHWEIKVEASSYLSNALIESAILPMARVRRGLPSSKATYRWHAGNQLRFYNDASTDASGSVGAFADLSKAISQARHLILIAGWSFHAHVRLSRGKQADVKETIGYQLIQAARSNPDMVVAILTWNHTPVAADDYNNDHGESMLKSFGIKLPSNLHWRAGGRSDLYYSHHQKFVVCDCPAPWSDGRRGLKAFFGGLDISKGRFDWPDHPIFPQDPGADRFLDYLPMDYAHIPTKDKFHDWAGEFGKKGPRQPWHDVHAQLIGPTAWDVMREFIGRWITDGDEYWEGDGDTEVLAAILGKFLSLFDKKDFVQQWESHPGPWAGQVYRSILKKMWKAPGGINGTLLRGNKVVKEALKKIDHNFSDNKITTPVKNKLTEEFKMSVKGGYEKSIQEAYLRAIAQAEHFIYIETQYFIGSGDLWHRKSIKNKVPEALIRRIYQRISDDAPFHVYIVIPMYPNSGSPDSKQRVPQREFQWKTINAIAYYLNEKLRKMSSKKSWTDYLSVYFLAQWHDRQGRILTKGGREHRVQANQRYMIYVHSKLMIVDDRYVILGSGNLNERSLAGDRDTEICIGLWPATPSFAQRKFTHDEDCMQEVQRFRGALWQEHLLSDLPTNWRDAGSDACVKAVQKAAKKNYLKFRRGEGEGNQEGHLAMFPMDRVPGTLFDGMAWSGPKVPGNTALIPDHPEKMKEMTLWAWRPVWGRYSGLKKEIIHELELAE